MNATGYRFLSFVGRDFTCGAYSQRICSPFICIGNSSIPVHVTVTFVSSELFRTNKSCIYLFRPSHDCHYWTSTLCLAKLPLLAQSQHQTSTMLQHQQKSKHQLLIHLLRQWWPTWEQILIGGVGKHSPLPSFLNKTLYCNPSTNLFRVQETSLEKYYTSQPSRSYIVELPLSRHRRCMQGTILGNGTFSSLNTEPFILLGW